MDSSSHISFIAEDRSYFAILKKEIHNLVAEAGFTETKIARVDIIIAEIASNLVKHAGRGEILVKIFTENDQQAIEIISVDSGPGMAEPNKMMEDGISTSNTLGHGLGAINRLSDFCQLYSLRDWGTILLSRVYRDDMPVAFKKPLADVRHIIVPKPGETLSGDGAYSGFRPGQLILFLGDGLGHGPEAHLAVQKAVKVVENTKSTNPVDILQEMHKEVKKTRGLVGAVAIYNFNEKKWRVCGVGNIATSTHYVQPAKSYMSHNGIIGMNIPSSLKEQEVVTERGQVIILCSDGIRTRWDLQKYVGIFKYDLSILAAAVYKDFGRKTDDMSVLVSRLNTVG